MAKMTLWSASYGTFTFVLNPSKMPDPRAKKFASVMKTYGGAQYYSWGTSIAGEIIYLEWGFMRATTFASFDTLLQRDESMVFNPQNGTGFTYNVELLDLAGEMTVGTRARKNVSLKMTILSKV